MKKNLGGIVLFLLVSVHDFAQADPNALFSAAASTISTEVARDLVSLPRGGLGVFAIRWQGKSIPTLNGFGVRAGMDVWRSLAAEIRLCRLTAQSENHKTTLIPLEGALTWRTTLSSHLRPYFGGGIGYYWLDTNAGGQDPQPSDQSAGYFALSGINLTLGPVILFTEAKYNLIGPDDDLKWRQTDVAPQQPLDGWSFLAGIKLGF